MQRVHAYVTVSCKSLSCFKLLQHMLAMVLHLPWNFQFNTTVVLQYSEANKSIQIMSLLLYLDFSMESF